MNHSRAGSSLVARSPDSQRSVRPPSTARSRSDPFIGSSVVALIRVDGSSHITCLQERPRFLHCVAYTFDAPSEGGRPADYRKLL